MTTNRLVIIHDTDADGIAAAWCINRGFREEYDDVLLIPQRAGVNTIPEGLLQTDSIYMVDRTYPWDTLIALSQQVFSVTVIDHHKSAMLDYIKYIDDVGIPSTTDYEIRTATSVMFDHNNITVTIDTNHSACMLAHLWVLEHGIDPDTSLTVPWFISYIEDRDIWAWKLPNSREINAGLHYYGHTFEQYDTCYLNCDPAFEYNRLSDIAFVQNTGKVVLQTQLNIIKSIAHGPTVRYQMLREPDPVDACNELRVAIVCCPFTLISDLGSYMLNYSAIDDITESANSGKVAQPFVVPDVVLCYNETETNYIYSIRSKHDMIWLAKHYGGGGHANACGFSSSVCPKEILKFVIWR